MIEKFNIYYLSLNPKMEDWSEVKRKDANVIFSHFKYFKETDVNLGKVIMKSFRPRDNKGYAKFFDFFLEEIKGPAILILNTLFDCDHFGPTAFSRLQYALSLEKIEAIYIRDYSMKYDVEVYMEYLERAFKAGKGANRPRRVDTPEEVKDAIIKLRSENPPVMFLDIAEVLSMQESMVRAIASKASSSFVRGRSITQKQIEFLKDAMIKAREKEYERFEVMEEA